MSTYEIQVFELVPVEGQSYPDSKEVLKIELADIDFKKFVQMISEYGIFLNEESYSVNGKVSKITKN